MLKKFKHLWLAKFLHLKYDCRNLGRQKMLMFRYVTLTSISDRTSSAKVSDNKKSHLNILFGYQVLSITSVPKV